MREKEKVILRLYSVIKDRIKNNAENSYVNSLHKAGINKISEKLGEEAVETIIAILAKQKKDIQIVFPVHLNPKVRIPVNQILSGLSNLHLFEPMEYQKFIHLMSISNIILTDSGGIQEEAPSLGKPVLVMRDCTERIEALSAGSIKLVGTNSKKIIEETMTLLDDRDQYLKMAQVKNPYGDGTASEKILKALKNFEKIKI